MIAPAAMSQSLHLAPNTASKARSRAAVDPAGTRTSSAWVPSIRWPKIHPMPSAPSEPRQCEYMPFLQNPHFPHAEMHERMTRSPTASVVTADPISVIRPGVTAGTSPFRMCRSVPQMVVAMIFTITSVGCWMTGSGTSFHSFWPGPR